MNFTPQQLELIEHYSKTPNGCMGRTCPGCLFLNDQKLLFQDDGSHCNLIRPTGIPCTWCVRVHDICKNLVKLRIIKEILA